MSDTVRLHVIFYGRVQGVFFRATTREIARQLGVTGYVWNLPDGSVEMEAQAAPYLLNELLTRIQQQYEGHVTRVERRDLPLHDDERDFEIRHER